jgi:NAD(P)-dependent dehydrogenase (short-subunit alcohol dehydrogenase family)
VTCGRLETRCRSAAGQQTGVPRFGGPPRPKYGRLDVAFNNAGITIEKPLQEYTAGEFDDVLGTNLRGVFLSSK